MLCSIDKDGLMNGYDFDLIKYTSKNLNLPVIASGAGSYSDFQNAIINGASAVAASSIFYFTHHTPNEAKSFLLAKNIPIRRTFKL